MEMLGIATPASFKSLVLALILAILLGMWCCFWFTVRNSVEGLPRASTWPYYSIFPHFNVETRSVSKCVCSNYTLKI